MDTKVLTSDGTTAWFRSLAVRVAVGFMGTLCILLLAQTVVFRWMVSRAESGSADSPFGLVNRVGERLSEALAAPSADLSSALTSVAQDDALSVTAVMHDGRMAVVGSSHSEDSRGPTMCAPVTSGAKVVGTVYMTGMGPPANARVALVATTAAGVMAGSGLMAGLLLMSTRRRLKALESASQQIARGDLLARADTRGGDEVAAVAVAFNRMALSLEQAARETHTTDLARRQLLADVSHELLTPLTIMRGYLDKLETEEGERTQDGPLAIVFSELARLERLVDDLLDLAVLTSGAARWEVDDVIVEELVGHEVSRHALDAQRRRITLTTHIDPAASLMTGDPHRLAQALHNLTSNAMRHTPDGGRVAIVVRQADMMFEIAVSNNGEAIDPEHQTRIFDRFYKVDHARSKPGPGLGLSIVKAIAERHGGYVFVLSAPGTDTTFAMRIPVNPT
jgi:signal transduction histidine kinase